MGQPAYADPKELVLSQEEFQFFQSAIKRLAGIHMTTVKKDLVQTRLRTHVLKKGLSSFADYQNLLKNCPDNHEEWEVFVNLLTTNKTDFFREPEHFDFLQTEFMQEWLKTKNKTLKIWCAASSSGEEPYTIAMTLADVLPKDRDFTILATDIDTKVLSKASNAVYPITKFKEIPKRYHKYVQTGSDDIEKWMRMHPSLKNKITFKKFNLIDDVFPRDNEFDIIFCRNVLIYFTPETIEQVLTALYPSAKNGAYLLLSHSESLQNMKTPWKFIAPSIYVKGGK